MTKYREILRLTALGLSQRVLWSSFFVTLVAKKYRLATMLPFVLVWCAIAVEAVRAYMIIVNVCKFFYFLIECFFCCEFV